MTEVANNKGFIGRSPQKDPSWGVSCPEGFWLILALVVGWGYLPFLLTQALAEPPAFKSNQPVASLKAKPGTCQRPPDVASLRVAVRERASREGPPSIGQLAALPRQKNLPTLPPCPALSPKASTKASSRVTILGRLPLAFIKNKGQVHEQAKFYVRTGGQTVWLTNEGFIFDLLRFKGGADPAKPDTARDLLSHSPLPRVGEDKPPHPALSPLGERIKVRGERDEGRGQTERLVFAQDFVGANKHPRIEASNPQPGIYNFFLGNDPAKWRTGVKAYAEVLYRDIWEGIDLKLSGNGRDLEQEFIVKPGADLGRIRVAYRGIEGLQVAEDGSLLI